jgi:hypothetical protein
MGLIGFLLFMGIDSLELGIFLFKGIETVAQFP